MNEISKILIDKEVEAKQKYGHCNADEAFRFVDQTKGMPVYNFTDKNCDELIILGEKIVDKLLIDLKIKYHQEEHNDHIFEAPYFELDIDPEEFVIILTESQLEQYDKMKYFFKDIADHCSLESNYKDPESGHEILFKFTPYDYYCIAGDVYRISYKMDFVLGGKI